MKECPDCGENLADDAVHCGKCGTKVDETGGENEKQTMFGMGSVSQEDLEQAAEEAKAASAEGDSSEEDEASEEDDGGFRLPRPGETSEVEDEADESGGQQDAGAGKAGGEGEGGTRLGLKGPAGGESQDPSLAKTEAMPSVDKPGPDDDTPEKKDASELDGGRLSSPKGGERGDVGSSPDVDSEAVPPEGDSPFAGEKSGQQTGGMRSTQDSGRPVPEGPGDPESMADTTPESSTRGPTAETAPSDSRPGPDPVSSSQDAGGDTAADLGPNATDAGAGSADAGAGATEPDPDAGPGDTGPSSDGGSSDQPVSGTATTTGSSEAQSGISTPSESSSEAPEMSSSSSEPDPGSNQRATSPEGETGPVEKSRDALAGDDRFGDGQDQQMVADKDTDGIQTQPPGQQEESGGGMDTKTLYIVLGVLAASGVLCAGAGFLVYMFMT